MTETEEQECVPLSDELRGYAIEAHKNDAFAVRMSVIPREQDGSVKVDFAGPLMNNMMPIVAFAVRCCLGFVNDEQTEFRKIINQYYGQDAYYGLGEPDSHGESEDVTDMAVSVKPSLLASLLASLRRWLGGLRWSKSK